MKSRLGFLLAVLLVLSWIAGAAQSQTAGFHISGRNLLDANGNNFVMRGISHAHTWYPGQTSAFAHIKNAAANTIRVVLSSGARWTKNSASDVANVIALCKANKLICVLEVHDTTGYGEQSGAISLAQAVTYWQEIQSVLTGQEAYVIINLGNEPYGNVNASGWITDTINAIAAMRSAGFDHTLMVDAPNWGQDWQFIMRDNAATVFNSDPDHNTIFSIHMYGVFNTASKVQSYISTFVNNGLPLVIGEFGWYHTDGDPDEDAIMAQAQSNGIGYIGWSWSGNGGGVEYLDMVTNFDPNHRTDWGTRIIAGANGLQQTSVEASVYATPTPTHTPAPTHTPTPANSPTPTSTPTQTPTNTPTQTPTSTPSQTPTNTPTPTETPQPATLGDVNGDRLVDSTDALIILSADVGTNTSQFCPMNCGDVNGDGYIDSTDALIVLSYDVGMSVPYPVGQPGCPASVTQPPGCSP